MRLVGAVPCFRSWLPNLSTESGRAALLVVSANLPWRIRSGIVNMPGMTRRYIVKLNNYVL
jgi:hypothetical protein